MAVFMDKFIFSVMKGHRVASGMANDPRFIQGTITTQIPYFKTLGLDLSGYYPGTLNAKFACTEVALKHFDYQFTQVKWHKSMAAESFNFCRCQIINRNKTYKALIYQPVALTKTEHFHPKNQLELIAPLITNVKYGDRLIILTPKGALLLTND